MNQNLIDMEWDVDRVQQFDAALNALEASMAGVVALTIDQRRELTKMGDKSEAFCRQAVDAFRENPGVLPRNFDLDGFVRDMLAFDVLRPRAIRLERMLQKVQDTQMALGSDLMTNALDGYAVLKVAGKGEGLEKMRDMLGARFNRRGRRDDEAAEEVPAGA